MSLGKIHKETAVPTTLEANAIYLVGPGSDPALLEIYVVNSAGDATRKTMGPTEVQALIDASISGIAGTEIVADITARDALVFTSNALVVVEDASADPQVGSGAALYIYNSSTDAYGMLVDYESLNLSLTWASITNGPSSSPNLIDAAVTASHSHANATELDKISEDTDGDPTYAGINFVMSGAINW